MTIENIMPLTSKTTEVMLVPVSISLKNKKANTKRANVSAKNNMV